MEKKRDSRGSGGENRGSGMKVIRCIIYGCIKLPENNCAYTVSSIKRSPTEWEGNHYQSIHKKGDSHLEYMKNFEN